MRKRSRKPRHPKRSLEALYENWSQAMEDQDYSKALNVRRQAEPIFKNNRKFLTATPPSKGFEKWWQFLVFINDTSRGNLIKAIRGNQEPEHELIYPPFIRENHPIKFF